MAERERFELSTRVTPGNGFRDRRIRPLCHLSKKLLCNFLDLEPRFWGERSQIIQISHLQIKANFFALENFLTSRSRLRALK